MGTLATTYSHMAYGHTTIGAERFHFRVRKGIGWFPLAIITREFCEVLAGASLTKLELQPIDRDDVATQATDVRICK